METVWISVALIAPVYIYLAVDAIAKFGARGRHQRGRKGAVAETK